MAKPLRITLKPRGEDKDKKESEPKKTKPTSNEVKGYATTDK